MGFKLIEIDKTGKEKEILPIVRKEQIEFKLLETDERVIYPDEPKKLTKFKRNKQY